MAAYRYQAIASGGSVVTGVLDAADEISAIEQIRGMGQFPVSATLASGDRLHALLKRLRGRDRVPLHLLGIATQELATLLKSGLNLDRALTVLEQLGDLGPLQRKLSDVRTKVHGGQSFADALAEDSAFPKIFVSMVRAGEVGGTLEESLGRLADYLSRTVAIRTSITSALVYPAILIVTAVLSIAFILTFVLPQFEPLLREAGHSVPAATQLVMDVGDALRAYWWLLIVLAIVLTVFVRYAMRRPTWRLEIDRRLLAVPVLGPLVAALSAERLCRTLGMLLSNGVPLTAALPVAADVVGNRAMAVAVHASATGLREGDGLAQRLGQTGLFPRVMVDLIQVAEQTGSLDEMLLRQADLDQQRIRHTIDRLLAILVPVLTVGLGLLVASLIASLMTAILSVNDLALSQ